MSVLNMIRKVRRVFIIFLYAVLSLVTFVAIITRYFPDIPSLHGTMEISRYSLIWLIFLVCSINIRNREDLSVNYFIKKMNKPLEKFFLLLDDIIISLFILILIIYGYKMALANMVQVSPSLNFPMTYVYAAIPVGGIFMLIENIINIVERIKMMNKNK